MTRTLRFTVLLIALTALMSYLPEPKVVHAQTTHNAANCEEGTLQTLHDSGAVQNGDTIRLPAGTCQWTTTVQITKGIHILGQGEDVTIIQDRVNKSGTPGFNSAFHIQVQSNLDPSPLTATPTFRLSGFTMNGCDVNSSPSPCNTAGSNDAHIRFWGSSKAIRVDHIKFTNMATSGIYINGDHWGLVDHVTFQEKLWNNGVIIKHYTWGGAAHGDGSWAAPWTPGGRDAIFIENSTDIDSVFISQTAFINDCGEGGRFVIRYNTFINSGIQNHGLFSGQRERSCRSMEIYENDFTVEAANGTIDTAIWIEGGTGVVWNNRILPSSIDGSYNVLIKSVYDRAYNGAVPWDCDPPSYCGNATRLCNGTSPYDQNAGSPAGYRCADQPGAGTSNLLSGDVPAVQWIGNILDPLYIWGNTVPANKTVWGEYGSTAADIILTGRDVILSARPGYTPYVYPHPLQSGENPPPVNTAPAVFIESPTNGTTFETLSSVSVLQGTVSDDVAVVSLTWANDRGGSGSCTPVGGPGFTCSGIALQTGLNVLTVTATDGGTPSLQGTDQLTALYLAPNATLADNFNRADFSSSGPWWTHQGDAARFAIAGNQIAGVGDFQNCEFWNQSTADPNQFSQMTVRTVADSTRYVGVSVRATGLTANELDAYFFRTDGLSGAAHSIIGKYSNGSLTALLSIANTFTTGDVIKLEVIGNTLTAYKNDVSVGTVEDTDLVSGQYGTCLFGAGAAGDDWSGGNLGGESPVPRKIRFRIGGGE